MDFAAFFTTYFIVVLVINGLLALIPAYIAEQKGRSFAGFWWLSLFTTVIIGLIAVLAMPELTDEQRQERKRQTLGGDGQSQFSLPSQIKCPYCAEMIKSEAVICKHCGKDVSTHIAGLAEQARLANEKAQMDARRASDEAELEARAAAERAEFELLALKAAREERQRVNLERLNRLIRKPLTWVVAASVVGIWPLGSLALKWAAENAHEVEVQNEVNARKENLSVYSTLEAKCGGYVSKGVLWRNDWEPWDMASAKLKCAIDVLEREGASFQGASNFMEFPGDEIYYTETSNGFALSIQNYGQKNFQIVVKATLNSD